MGFTTFLSRFYCECNAAGCVVGVRLLVVLQGVNIHKLIEAGQYISNAIGRKTGSKVAQATHSSL